MTLKEIIKMDFGVELPISGGFGNSVETPIIIHPTDLENHVELEYFILDCLGKGRRIDWRVLEQSFLCRNGKKMDKIKIETKQTNAFEIITQIENYYFDITECLENEKKTDPSFNEKEIMEKIKNRLTELGNMNAFNKNCIDLLLTGELFKDDRLTLEFLDVIFKDESITLFESIMDNKKKPILEVLRIIGSELKESRS